METHRRGADGRRSFSPEFKREQISRVMRQEVTLAELSREFVVQPSVIRRWTHLVDRGSTAAIAANDDVVPASELRAAQQRIRELERLVGKKAMEIEILQAARDEVKKSRVGTARPRDDRADSDNDLPGLRDRARDRVSPRASASPAVAEGRRSRGDGADS